MKYNVKPRVLIDWNNDGFFCRDARPGDKLNLIPKALSYYGIQKGMFGALGASFIEKPIETDYGLQVFNITTGTHAFGGFLLGQNAGVSTIPITPSTTYRATVWVRGISGSYGSTPVNMTANDETFAQLGASSNLTVTANWQKITFSFTSGAGSDYLYLFLRKNNNANNIVIQAAGFMLTATNAAVSGYNTGAISDLYENVSSDTLDATWETGVTDAIERLPSEGVANYRLNNSTRRYSPAYTESPLYGLMNKQLRTRIEIQNPTTSAYQVMWAGFVRDYDINAGKKRPEVAVSCEQGMFALDAAAPNVGLLENTTASEILEKVAYNSSWQSANTPYGFYVNRSLVGLTWLGGTDYDGQTEMLVTPSAPDPIDLPLAGDSWTDGNSKPRDIIKDTIQVDQGYLFMLKNGMLKYRDRSEITYAATDLAINLDDNVFRADYKNAEYSVNKVISSYYPSGLEENVVLWNTRSSIPIDRGKRKTIRVKFEYSEGEKMTVHSVNAFNAASNPSIIIATTPAGTSVPVGYVVNLDLENGTAKIYVKNVNTFTIRVSITLKGTVETSVDAEQVEATREVVHPASKSVNIDNRLLKTEDMALDLSNYILAVYGDPYDEFQSLVFKPKSAAMFGAIMNLDNGDIIELSEYQTALEDRKHIVMGMEGSYRPGSDVELTLTTARIEPINDYIVGSTQLGDGGVLGY